MVAGGETRAQSVKRGLDAIEAAEVVAVHDAVRPLVTPEEIDRVVQAAAESGAAILVAPVSDTIKEVTGQQVMRTVPRANLRRALTPQCFRLEILKRAYDALPEIEASGLEVNDDRCWSSEWESEWSLIEGQRAQYQDYDKGRSCFGGSILKSIVSRS